MTDTMKDKLLDAVLPLVPFEGWSDTTLHEAAQEQGLSLEQAQVAFPRGIADVVRYYNSRLDDQMMREMEHRGVEDMKIRERIALAVRLRLELMEPHREAVRKGLSFFVMPLKASEGLHSLWDTVDAMWLAAGDRATDYNFYTKRMLLGGVYSSTLLYWLEDDSEDHVKTWAFLDRRIGEVLKIGGTLGKGLGRVANAVHKLSELTQPKGGVRHS